MAEELGTWLMASADLDGGSTQIADGKNVIVIGIVGNTSSTATLINSQLFGSRQVFQPIIDPTFHSPHSIQAFHSASEGVSTLYLLLCPTEPLGYLQHNTGAQVMTEWDEDFSLHLHLLISTSHLLLFVNSRGRFDMCWFRGLREVMLRSRSEFSNKFSSPSRLLFALALPPSIEEAPYRKRRDLINKMEESLESQIHSMLKWSDVIDRQRGRRAIATLPPKGEKFVHLFTPAQDAGEISERDGVKQRMEQRNAATSCVNKDPLNALLDALEDVQSEAESIAQKEFKLVDFVKEAVHDMDMRLQERSSKGRRSTESGLTSLHEAINTLKEAYVKVYPQSVPVVDATDCKKELQSSQ